MIYIAAHKKFDVPNQPGYIPLQVGAEGKASLGYLADNTGDNISRKNANYCELTGLYWIWKNTDDSYKGLVHYRRYFSNRLSRNKILSVSDIEQSLKKYDVILPFRCTLNKTLTEDYCEISGFKKDLIRVQEIIERKYPEYLSAYKKIMNGNQIHFFNMMIAKKDVFNNYCKWLFDILFELEKEVDLTGYNAYQKRIYGFLSERLLNVYFEYNDYRVMECGVINTEENWNCLKRMLTALKRKILYYTQLSLKCHNNK